MTVVRPRPFKPTRTFEAVVRELVAGLEDGTIVLSEEANKAQPEKQPVEIVLSANSPSQESEEANNRDRAN